MAPIGAVRHPPFVTQALAAKRCLAESVLDHIADGDDVIVGLANGEPVTVLDAIEAHGGRLRDVRLHQMLPLRERPYIHGKVAGLRHVSWFLSPACREAFAAGACDLVPNDFSEVPALMRRATKRSLVVTAGSPPDRHGYFSLGPHADYVAAFIGQVPFFVEVNHRMPRTFGENQVHVSEVLGWCEADYALAELPAREPTDIDRTIAGLVAERIPDGATIQAGIGTIPDETLALLTGHHHLGVHSELLSDGLVKLVDAGAATGVRKRTHRGKVVTTNAIGTRRVYDFVDENPGVEFWPVDYTNNARVIAREPHMIAINATLEVDFLGQCASESLGSRYWSSSGGQSDFARGAMSAEEGQAFIVLRSTAGDDSVSRIVPQLHPGAAVTTFKNIVDKVVTEYGVAELHGSTIRDRARKLIGIAHPKFRADLEQRARDLGFL